MLKCTVCRRVIPPGSCCYVLTQCEVLDNGDYARKEDSEVYCVDCIPYTPPQYGECCLQQSPAHKV